MNYSLWRVVIREVVDTTLHYLGFHKYKEIRNSGKYSYQECLICKDRRIKTVCYGGHQAVDWNWVKSNDNNS